MKEIRLLLQDLDVSVLSMQEAGIDIDVEENGTTFEENALKKAVEIMEVSNKIVLADDSGLEIDYLDKAPGIYSARYLGKDTPYDIKNELVLEKLKDVPYESRTARFVAVIALAIPECVMPKLSKDERYCTKQGILEGYISDQAAGDNRFGYDPIFYVPKYKMTLAQMPIEQKNQISHRAIAMQCMKEHLEEILRGE